MVDMLKKILLCLYFGYLGIWLCLQNQEWPLEIIAALPYCQAAIQGLEYFCSFFPCFAFHLAVVRAAGSISNV